MKKLNLLIVSILMVSTFFSCGDDDDGAITQDLSASIILESPFIFQNVGVNGVTFNPNENSEQEIQELLNTQFIGSAITFGPGGLGIYTIGESTLPFTYTITGDDVSTNVSDLYFNNVVLDGSALSFDWEYCISTTLSSDACADVRLSYL
jgi:hypothetical protein